MNQPIIYKDDYDFEIGKAITLKEGKDIAIIATGGMVHQSILASEHLEDMGISCKVINMHTIKPIDNAAILETLDAKLIVTVEEHSTTGGLGSSVAELLSELSKKPPQLRIGVSSEYKPAGSYDYMLEQYGLTNNDIVEKILKKYGEVN
jgi:transketolase